MPISPSEAASIQAGADVAGAAINAWSGASQNKKQREWASNMYAQQRDDNIVFWNMQNQYNSPENQMRMYKEAGLNPNLIYGNGQFTKADSLRAPDAKMPQQTVPQWGDIGNAVGPAINTYYNVQKQQQDLTIGAQQLQNLKANEELTKYKSLSEILKPDYLKALTGKTNLSTEQDREKFQYLLEGMQLTNNNIRQRTKQAEAQTTYLGTSNSVMAQENDRRNKMVASTTSLNIAKSVELAAKTAHTYESINNLKAVQRLVNSQAFVQEMEGFYRAAGTSFSDGAVGRTIAGLPAVNKVMRTIVQDWDKLDPAQQAQHLFKFGFNQANY
jgi:hypothetical protein